jgi:hypothetical protein
MCGRCERKKTQTRIGGKLSCDFDLFSIQSIMIDKMQSRGEKNEIDRQRERASGSERKCAARGRKKE